MTGLPAFPLANARSAARVARAITVLLVLGGLVSAAAGNLVVIKRGDTLTEIARRYHTTVPALRELNGMSGNTIYAGKSLRVPGRSIDSKPAPRTTRAQQYHTVVSGDSLTAIARRYRTSVSWLQARNKLPRSRVIIVGAKLDVGPSALPPAAAPATASLKNGRSRTRLPAAVPRSRVKELITAEAKRAGVDPALALALAWQESGFQQDIISSAGAVGVMQVMPDTGRWMATHVLRRPIDLRNVEDNVVAGVQFLALLIRMTGKTPAALAGYYQGLASVRARGEYADTKAYVRNILFLQRRFARG